MVVLEVDLDVVVDMFLEVALVVVLGLDEVQVDEVQLDEVQVLDVELG